MARRYDIVGWLTGNMMGGMLLLMLLAFPLSAQDVDFPDDNEVQQQLQLTPASIRHIPLQSTESGKPFLLTARLMGNVYVDEVAEARVWYCEYGSEYYDFVDMYPISREYSAYIPLDQLAAERIEYFIEFVMVDGSTITYPALDPDINPVVVVVEGALGAGEVTPPLVVLSPDRGSIWRDNEVQLVVSLNQNVRLMNASTIRVKVDGRDRTGSMHITNDLIIGTLTRLKDGPHTVGIYLANSDGYELIEEWTFRIILPKIIASRQQEYLHGDVHFSGVTQNVNDEALSVGQETIRLRGNYKKLSYEVKGRFSSQENKTLQPQHNYMATVATPHARIKVGDINPHYNRLVLYGRRVRGVEMQFDFKYFKMQLIHGDMRRAVDSRVLRVDSTLVDDDPLNPFYEVDSTYQRGTYRRWVNAMHYSLGKPDVLMMGFTLMKVKDDIHSIKNGPAGQDNLVSGYDVQFFLDKKRVSLSIETGFSLYNADIRPGAMAEYNDYAKYIVINQYFSPLPSDSSGNMSDVLKSMMDQSFSYRTELRLQYYNNDLRFGIRKINRAYRSLGVSGLLYDTQGYSIRDRIRLFRGFLHLNLGYEGRHDNVLGKSEVTTSNNRVEFGIGCRPFWIVPTTQFTYRRVLNENDGKRKTLVSGDLLTNPIYTVIDQRLHNMTNTYSLLMTKRLFWLDLEHDLSWNMTLSRRDDDYNSYGEADQQLYNLSANTYYPGGISSNFYFASAHQAIGDGLTDFRSKTISARVEYSMLNGNLLPFVSTSLNFGKGDLQHSTMSPEDQYQVSGADMTDPDVIAAIDTLTLTTVRKSLMDVVMIDYTIGTSWEFMLNHRISASLGFVHYLDQTQIEYWNGASYPNDQVWVTNSSETLHMTFQQPGAVRGQRNDYTARITYSYRF